ncbi:MAG: aryl-sulfate sulfohydrolase [Armatimonadetes bacterium CG_4_10_14_0_8_um_filter_66_14]|nr:sulfatase [Armatimonadota bacterium]NCP28657.1 sulfatase [Armatimonadota bacterium]NCQ27003.1 sulfatase [Armatimonadota bacterium]PIZ42554.1 MAG: aryl-sulfate sulfohydrolase [Armatimonadetes bacterium CG_4_10_14_0_8_um_filter_66_14]
MTRHTRRDFLRFAGGGAVAAFGRGLTEPARRRGSAEAAERKPNLVLLFADDLGWTELGCFGSGYYETPNLDRLCAQGVRFTSAYSAAANCAPSRACLLSGQYVPRHGVYTVGGKRRFDNDKRLLKWNERKLLAPDNEDRLPPEKVTFAEALKAAGYATGMFGKWHLGNDESARPKAQGFDEAVVMAGAQHFGFNTIPPPKTKPGKDDYLSDYLADQALAFLERNRDRPFLLYLPDFLVHVPLEAKQALIEKYQRKPPVGGHGNPVYAGMVEALDFSFGRVLKKLDELGLADNTLVVFFSDNGGVGSAKNRGLDHAGGTTSNDPLRGMKGMLYEGGIRVPMIARWPGVTRPGTVCAEPVHGVDLFPTFLEAAGATPPTDQVLDGESLVPLLAGRAEHLKRTELFWFMPGYLPGRQAPANAMRSGDWKLIESFEDGRLELFNLKDDLGETRDIAAELPDKVKELHERMRRWRQSVGAQIPPRNPDWDPKNEGRW